MTLQSNKGLPISPGARLLGDLSRDPEIPWLPSSHFLLRPTALSTEKPPLCWPQTEKTPMPGEGGRQGAGCWGPHAEMVWEKSQQVEDGGEMLQMPGQECGFSRWTMGASEGYIEMRGND